MIKTGFNIAAEGNRDDLGFKLHMLKRRWYA